ncbi:tetratricopeptide repeat protein [Fulvivirga lutimaris]|uniref:tetratricopeptide repeat protein n=1 Tax=Fulvivirga lutimaris TaxID=1819566 RepID=UPI0012BCDF5C|nr:tetratricopeptide repeat protein [Fulvivirga lutimaris]MTI39591.1 tetratricopeptide repeat protein [Fulvivirga lutimaris]
MVNSWTLRAQENVKESDLLNAPDSAGKVDVLNDLCKSLWFSDLNKSMYYGNKALALSLKINYAEGEATALNNIGVGFWIRGEHDRALDSYYQAINIRDSIGGAIGLGNTYHNIGNIFRSRKNWDEAINWFNKSLKLRYEIDDQLGISYSINNLGLIAQERGNYDSALMLLNQGLKIRKAINNSRGIATSLLSIGKLHNLLNRDNLARNSFEASLKIWKEINHLQGQAMTYLELSKLSLENEAIEESLLLSEKGLEAAKKIDAKSEILELHEHRRQIYLETEDYVNAHNELLLATNYKDSIFNEQKLSLIQQFNFDEISKQNRQLKDENNLQSQLLLEQKKISNAIIVICALLILSIFLIYRVLRIRSKNNKRLSEKNDQIERQNKIIEEANMALEHKVEERTKNLKNSNERLIKYSLFNSHKIRGPLARLLGLTYLSTISTKEELPQYIELINNSAVELDQQIKDAGKELTDAIEENEKIYK